MFLPPLGSEGLGFGEGDELWVRISAILVQKTPRLLAQGLGQFLMGVAQGQVHHARGEIEILVAIDIANGGALSALENDAGRIAPAQHMPEPIRKSTYSFTPNWPHA